MVANRDNSRTESVLRSSKTLIIEGEDGGGCGGGGAVGVDDEEAVDDASFVGVGDESELLETSSTSTIVLIECVCLFRSCKCQLYDRTTNGVSQALASTCR
ncbi:unnamed protein product [Rotaria socialis]|uniref:Uncharacterized protein n=1 Tax=Rotaria socialis TaxID=392032 RepID=A0A821YWI4_9BILA|nr:unnamed protein product [Rotaria socialis]